jgi:hypothetical protein
LKTGAGLGIGRPDIDFAFNRLLRRHHRSLCHCRLDGIRHPGNSAKCSVRRTGHHVPGSLRPPRVRPGRLLSPGSRRQVCKASLLSFAGGLSAWGYLIGWSFVLSIFALKIGTYLQKLIPAFGNIQEVYLSLASGAVVFSLVLIVNFRGLGNSSRFAYVLAATSLTPLLIITVSPLLTGSFKMNNITSNWLPDGWTWDPLHVMLLFGIFGMAEWSASTWAGRRRS